MTVALPDHLKQLNYFARALGECIEDIAYRRQGIPVFYNIDFGLLCPLLFSRPWQGSKEFLTSTEDGMRRVLNKASSHGNFALVVSGATVIEFFDQLRHMLRELQQRIPDIPRRYLTTNHLLRDSLKTSAEIRHELSLVTRRGLDERVKGPVSRFLHLLDDGSVRGIGDVLDVKAVRDATDPEMFERFFQEHKSWRLTGEQTRSVDDSLFHYKIDAANNCLTLAAAKDSSNRTLFVTPTPLNIRQCTVGDETYARLERTPLFSVNVTRLMQAGMIGDERRFMTIAVREALELLDELREYQRYDDCPGHLLMRLAKFYEVYLAPLNHGARREGGGVADEHLDVEDILRTISDKQRLQEVLDEAVQEIRDGAKQIEERSASFDLPYIDEFDFSSDPVLKRIRRDLGLAQS